MNVQALTAMQALPCDVGLCGLRGTAVAQAAAPFNTNHNPESDNRTVSDRIGSDRVGWGRPGPIRVDATFGGAVGGAPRGQTRGLGRRAESSRVVGSGHPRYRQADSTLTARPSELTPRC